MLLKPLIRFPLFLSGRISSWNKQTIVFTVLGTPPASCYTHVVSKSQPPGTGTLFQKSLLPLGKLVK